MLSVFLLKCWQGTTEMQCNHNGQTGKPPSRTRAAPSCCLHPSGFEFPPLTILGAVVSSGLLFCQKVSLPLLFFFRVIFFHREGLFSAEDHSSLRHRRLWEYQPLIMPTHPPAKTKLAKNCEKEHLYALGSEVRCDRIVQRCS